MVDHFPYPLRAHKYIPGDRFIYTHIREILVFILFILNFLNYKTSFTFFFAISNILYILSLNLKTNIMKVTEQTKKELRELLDDSVDSIFVDAHELANTNSGDITPHQSFRLAEIQDNLFTLLLEQVEQNLSEEILPLDLRVKNFFNDLINKTDTYFLSDHENEFKEYDCLNKEELLNQWSELKSECKKETIDMHFISCNVAELFLRNKGEWINE